jgi:hypothetical protein
MLAVATAVALLMLSAGPPKSRPRPKKARPAASKPTKAPRAPKPTAPEVDASGPAQAVLDRIQTLYQGLEYDQVIPLASAYLAREDLSLDQRIDAYRMQGSARAIVEDPIEAERPFRLLLRARANYEMPVDTPPKILAVFRKVQSEEKALAAQLLEVERRRIVLGLKLTGATPQRIKGGQPLQFSYRLKDPSGVVDTIAIPYRKAGERDFSTLALARGDAGDWTASLSGEVTATEKDTAVEYYVQTLDEIGPLLALGSADSPLRVDITKGLYAPERPKPIPPWLFWTGVGATAVTGLGAGAVGYSLQSTQVDYRNKANQDGISGRRLVQLQSQGNTLATATTVSLVSLGVAAAATLIMLPFTRFESAPVEP